MNTKRFTIGIDPDVTVLSMCILDSENRPWVISCNTSRKTNKMDSTHRVLYAINQIQEMAREVFTVQDKIGLGLWDAYIEDQYISRHSRANPQDLILLSKIAGAWAMAMVYHNVDIHLVAPVTWKGNCPKSIKQCRVLKGLGIEYEMMGKKDVYPVPLERRAIVPNMFDVPNKGDFKDINDSIGLAAYGRNKWTR